MLEGPEVMSGHCKSIKLNDYLARAPSGDAGCERRLPCSGGAGFQQSALARHRDRGVLDHVFLDADHLLAAQFEQDLACGDAVLEIGSASCRARVCQYV